MAKIEYVFTHAEIQQHLPYAVICETREGSRWDTMRRRRMWNAEFSDSEKKAATAIFRQARNWYLVKGAPDSVRMSGKTLGLWLKLGNFCASL